MTGKKYFFILEAACFSDKRIFEKFGKNEM
jgi:hypothetical protein